MVGNAQTGARRANRLRVAGWTMAALLLLLPLVAMQFTDEVSWTGADFIFAAVLIGGVGLAYELAVRMTPNIAYRAAAALALAAAFLLVWINAAVGIIGDEGNPANLMFGGVLAIAAIGAAIARFRSQGMARAMAAAALAQALVAIATLIEGSGSTGPVWPRDVLGLTGVFIALWLASAALFRKAAREG